MESGNADGWGKFGVFGSCLRMGMLAAAFMTALDALLRSTDSVRGGEDGVLTGLIVYVCGLFSMSFQLSSFSWKRVRT